MIVPSLPFLGFAAIAAVVFNLSAAFWWRQAVLLTANFAFLASYSLDPLAFLPFAGFLALGFVGQSVMRRDAESVMRRDARTWRFVGLLGMTLAAFFWLKRYSFVPSASFLPFPYLLVGLSYVFFRVLHLIIDSHQNAIDEPVGVLSYLNYTLNFTALTSGPIQRYQDYRRAELAPPPLDLVVAGAAVERIVVGYFKVAIVSMLLALAQHQAIEALRASQAMPERIWSGVLIAAIYPVYLYANFSGYCDVVIGVARFFRIALPENFDRPFAAENFLTFWSRWHITLSGWLKTYVFNPLMMAGMARITSPGLEPYLAVGAFFITFFLVGAWHGQTSEFLFFGVLQGGGVAANKLYQVLMRQSLGRAGWRALTAHPGYRACARGTTFTWFAFTLFWFWSTWGQIGDFMAALGPVALPLVWVAIFAAATLILAGMAVARRVAGRLTWQDGPVWRSRYVRTAWHTALTVVTVTVIVLLEQPAPDIVYKAF